MIHALKSEGNYFPPVKQQHMVGGVGPFRSRASQILDQLVDRHRRRAVDFKSQWHKFSINILASAKVLVILQFLFVFDREVFY